MKVLSATLVPVVVVCALFSSCTHSFEMKSKDFDLDPSSVTDIFSGAHVVIDPTQIKQTFVMNMTQNTYILNDMRSAVSDAIKDLLRKKAQSVRIGVQLQGDDTILLTPAVSYHLRAEDAWGASVGEVVVTVNVKSKAEVICDTQGAASGGMHGYVGTYHQRFATLLNDAMDQALSKCKFGTSFSQNAATMPVPSKPLTKEIIEKAKKCQDKGGVWLNDKCVIDTD
jgi:hypothetical protein